MKQKIPVTVLTGFLGSGKTTLLNRILREEHGQRFAVIENEYSALGIDQALLIHAEENIVAMNNGCICCSVRGDLVKIMGNLLPRSKEFDRVIIETTGLADPGPVAQTFFSEPLIASAYQLDGIVTLVDAKHIQQHLHKRCESKAQIAFADRLVLNKIDLVTEQERYQLHHDLAAINKMASIIHAEYANTPLNELLDIGGFDVNRALGLAPHFLEPEYPFEWAGAYELSPGRYHWEYDSTAAEIPAIRCVRLNTAQSNALNLAATKQAEVFNQTAEPLSQKIAWHIEQPGTYAWFFQHHPDECRAQLYNHTQQQQGARLSRTFKGQHQHDEYIGSVAFEFPGYLHLQALESWLNGFLAAHGHNLFRFKGIVAIHNEPNRFIFQGVHNLVEAIEGKPWADEEPFNRMVFIGRDLDFSLIERAIKMCSL